MLTLLVGPGHGPPLRSLMWRLVGFLIALMLVLVVPGARHCLSEFLDVAKLPLTTHSLETRANRQGPQRYHRKNLRGVCFGFVSGKKLISCEHVVCHVFLTVFVSFRSNGWEFGHRLAKWKDMDQKHPKFVNTKKLTKSRVQYLSSVFPGPVQ